MKDLRDYFDRVVVINLDRRRDRWEQVLAGLESMPWPFRPPVRQPAVDGDAVTVPIWWKQGGGAWGCMMSHARILEDCIREGVERVLIMEDDVLFVDDFAARAAAFLERVPDDWDQLYFGGQHLRDPVRLDDHVYKCVNVNRTHCHAVSRGFMSRMYRYILNAHDYIAHPGHHIDHRLGALHETGTVRVYAPTLWLAGQGEGRSDISGRSNATYFWNTWAGVPSMPMFAILGLHAVPTNQVAALLASVGVHFGYNLRGFDSPPMEDAGLASICETVLPFPATQRRITPEQSCSLLHDWCRLILKEAADAGTVGAACYPHLCAMHADMSKAWPRLKAIHVRSELSTAVDALRRRSAGQSGWLHIDDEQATAVQTFLHAGIQQWTDAVETLVVDVDRLESDRDRVTAELREFVRLDRIAPAGSTDRRSTPA